MNLENSEKPAGEKGINTGMCCHIPNAFVKPSYGALTIAHKKTNIAVYILTSKTSVLLSAFSLFL